jgi:uncharacterized protein YbbC (DUF1343 family)
MAVRPGISVLLDERQGLVAGKPIGVFTNHTGVLPDLTSSLDALRLVADVRAIFSPEHGLYGAAAEGAHVAGGTDRVGVPIYSLYGDNLTPTPGQLAGLAAIVCDIQDIGCRFYTYAWTLINLLEAATQAGVAVIVTDRPNPIGGAVEGPGCEPAFYSLVGRYDVPVRHGLTIGELARFVNQEAGIGGALTVVPCAGWRRDLPWRETGLPWAPPSPNMPALETTLVYPGTCLGEGVNISVGRGTAKPFEWLGAPWLDGVALVAALNDQNLPGVRWRPVAFVPCSGPYANEQCFGVQPHVTAGAVFRPVAAGVALLLALRDTHPDQFAVSAAGAIYADPAQMARRMYISRLDWNTAHFDRLAGSASLRAQITAGATLADITAPWPAYESRWRERVAGALLYE